MIIGVCGYGYTGSGAIEDFLREFSECSLPKYDFEFPFLYIPHGIQDLEYHLTRGATRFFSSDVAIKEYRKLVSVRNNPRGPLRKLSGMRFKEITEEYIEKITTVKWKGYSWDDHIVASPLRLTLRFRILGRIISLYERYVSKPFPLPPSDVIYLSVYPERFVEITREYICKLLESLQYDLSKKVVINQPFDVNNPDRSMKFFDNPKAIIVDRDPRDIYVLAKMYLKSEGSFIPSEKVDDYILYHKLIRKNSSTEGSMNILKLHFEDMIYDYENTAEKIIHFLNLENSKRSKKKYFDPAVSLGNTQLYLKHPRLKGDIKKIEKELSEYIYPFEQHLIKPDENRRPF